MNDEKTQVNDIDRSLYDFRYEEKEGEFFRLEQGLTKEIVEKLSAEKGGRARLAGCAGIHGRIPVPAGNHQLPAGCVSQRGDHDQNPGRTGGKSVRRLPRLLRLQRGALHRTRKKRRSSRGKPPFLHHRLHGTASVLPPFRQRPSPVGNHDRGP